MFLTGSKVGLGTPWRRIRDLFGPPLGLESCWGFAVSHASSTPCSRGPEVQANRGRSCHSLAVHCTVNFFFIRVPFRMHGRDTKVRHELSPGPIVFLTGSKVGLGTPWRRIRDLFGPPLGLESCWGFAVSHASSTPCSRGPEVQANRGRSCHSLAVHCTVNFFFIWVPCRMRCRGSGASVSQRFEGRVRHTVVFRRFGRAAEGAVIVSVYRV